MRYENYNNNPAGKRAGDCVIRAVAKATGLSWHESLEALYKAALEHSVTPLSKEAYEQVLYDNGMTKHKMPKHCNGTRYTARQLIDAIPDDIIVISVASHLATADSGVLYDTWDCSRKSVYNYYTMKGRGV